ncbi:survival factor 1 [Stachybotrys elegans]|uniref:Survival factor 1 n=1 Tax=Stachybotrys elegans TaxID=80388 RepID=A0A8K0T6J2_9HYPO|nr:survival factor 1 [Stachybotrys elegans]
MFNWAKQQLANVAGTQEPIYGPSAIKSVAEEAKNKPYTEVTRDHLKWQQIDSTCVESEVFYFFSESGQVALCQIIYSNVAGIRITSQFNTKVFSRNASEPHLWCSTPLNNFEVSEDKNSFYADDLAVELAADGNSYSIKSMNDQRAIVNLKITKTSPGFTAGETGKSLFGTDLSKPWGTMQHAFWPRCAAEGTITTKDGPIDFKGQALFIYALQGMKPHHAAAQWNFIDFQGPTHSAIMMEFTTPPSYGSTVVNVGCIAKDGQIISAGVTNTAAHTQTRQDEQTKWPEPTAVKFNWTGKSKDDKAVDAVIEGPLGERVDRVDVMAEVPGFVKSVVAGAVGTKPYIYQYVFKPTLKLKVGDEEVSEEGQLFMEATFITE